MSIAQSEMDVIRDRLKELEHRIDILSVLTDNKKKTNDIYVRAGDRLIYYPIPYSEKEEYIVAYMNINEFILIRLTDGKAFTLNPVCSVGQNAFGRRIPLTHLIGNTKLEQWEVVK